MLKSTWQGKGLEVPGYVTLKGADLIKRVTFDQRHKG